MWYSIFVPVIPNGRLNIEPYSSGRHIIIESDIISLEYLITERTTDTESHEKLIRAGFNAVSETADTHGVRAVERLESNNVIGRAIRGLSEFRIRMYKLDIRDTSLNTHRILNLTITFDHDKYNQVKPILEELAEIFDYDIMKIVDAVRK